MIGPVTKNGGRREMETYDRVCDQNGRRREMETYDRSVTKNGRRREMETYDRSVTKNGGRREMETGNSKKPERAKIFVFFGLRCARHNDSGSHEVML